MESYIFEGIVTALESVSCNGGQSFGITSKLRREKFVQPDGSVEEVPIISGNGMRGMLRDRGMVHMCRALGYGMNDENGQVTGLTLPAFYFLFSGGTLTSEAGRGLDIDLARKMRNLIPLVGIFGGAMGNQIMPGKIKVGKLMPIVQETAHLIPARFVPESPTSIWEYLQEEMYTRKDDEKNEHLRQLIAPETRQLLAAKSEAKRIKTDAGKPQDDTGEHQQMRYYVETIAAGTQMYWKLVLEDVTDVEFEAFLACLSEFARFPYVGGKSGVGMGKVKVAFDDWYKIDPNLRDADGNAVGKPIGTLYADHLRERCADIRKALNEIK